MHCVLAFGSDIHPCDSFAFWLLSQIEVAKFDCCQSDMSFMDEKLAKRVVRNAASINKFQRISTNSKPTDNVEAEGCEEYLDPA